MSFVLIRAVLWLSFSGYWIVLLGEIAYALSLPFFSGIVDSYMYDYLKINYRSQKMVRNYGRLNFYMSFSSAVSALIGPLFLADFPIRFLIVLELVCILLNLGLLMLLPETPVFNTRENLVGRYKRIGSILGLVIHKKSLLIPMLYSGLFSDTTILLVWCFQPLMVCSLIQIALW